MHKLIYLYNITIINSPFCKYFPMRAIYQPHHTTTNVPVRRAWFMKTAQANECCVQFLHI